MTRLTQFVLGGFLVLFLLGGAFICGPSWGGEERDAAQVTQEKQEQQNAFLQNKISVLREMASMYLEAHKHAEALETIQKLLDFSFPADAGPEVIADHEKSKAELYQQMAGIYLWEKKEPENAVKSYEKALTHVEKWDQKDTHTKTTKMEILKNLANSYRDMNQLDKALEYLKKAEEIQ